MPAGVLDEVVMTLAPPLPLASSVVPLRMTHGMSVRIFAVDQETMMFWPRVTLAGAAMIDATGCGAAVL